MGYPSNDSSFPNLKNGTEIPKTDQYKLTICCAIEIVFATKIELKVRTWKEKSEIFYP